MAVRSRVWIFGLAAIVYCCVLTPTADAQVPPAVVPVFENGLANWSAHPSEGVELRLSEDAGRNGGKALRLDFDFHGHAGYAIARRRVEADLPPNYEFTWWMRADAPVNNLELKLIDASGDNVWWLNRRDFVFPKEWKEIVTRKRQISFAWGPIGGGEIHHATDLEIVITAGTGGKGTVWIQDLALTPLPPEETKPVASGAWRKGESDAIFDIDFGHVREVGGLKIDWAPNDFARDFTIEASRDRKEFDVVRRVANNPGGRELLWLPEVDARVLRIAMKRSSRGQGWAVRNIDVEPATWASTVSDFFARVAEDAKRGDYPRYLAGQQPYWTIAGADRGEEEALVGEDGNVEPFKRGFSIEPFVRIGGRLLTWADVAIDHSLDRGDLPIVTSRWTDAASGVQLAVTSFVSADDTLYVRYRLKSRKAAKATLYLAVRPFQVNPTTQFLNAPGGASPISHIAFDGTALIVNDSARVIPLTPPRRVGASTFDEGNIVDAFRRGEAGAMVVSAAAGGDVTPLPTGEGGSRGPNGFAAAGEGRATGAARASRPSPLQRGGTSGADRLSRGERRTSRAVHDDFGYASAAFEYPLDLTAGKASDIVLAVPLNAKSPARRSLAESYEAQAATRKQWATRLDRVAIDIPAAPEFADTLRSNLAYILINADGPRLQPGSRSYERSWIRDGALIASVLLRLGHADIAREFAEWYAPFQFADGKVPCCVDTRGADPVPENDSHGELIFLVAEIWRYTHDQAFVHKMWPHVDAAARYIQKLRSENHGEFEGLLTESISHEGYSAKPMHSYWDDFFGVRGLEDAAELAQALEMTDRARELREQSASFRADLSASIRRSMDAHRVGYVPGSAELGDFDATSTAIAVSPLELTSIVPREALDRTFARYLDEFRARRDGKSKWDVYTPYELRNVGAFVRIGRRAEANELFDFFMRDRRPPAWNGWAEVVPREVRAPHFMGDMPHSWVGSDFMRSLLDFFAFDREDGALVVVEGVPEKWVDGSTIHVGPLETYTGSVDLKMRGSRDRVAIELKGTAKPRSGIVVRSPYDRPVRRCLVNGAPIAAAAEVRIHSLPARVVFEY